MAKIFEKKKYYFRNFPIVKYNLDGIDKDVLDFIHRWAFRKSVKNNIAAWSKWVIRDQDTMFSIAKTLYGSEYYFWVVLMLNDMIDPFFDWPLSDVDLAKFIQSKYGAGNELAIHHYEADEDENLYSLEPGTIVSADYEHHIPSGTTRNIKVITNYDYEAKLNEAKRSIKLLKPEFLQQVKAERDQILKTSVS